MGRSYFIFSFAFIGSLAAIPQNPSTVAGSVKCRQDGPTLEVIASDRSIVEWDSFSIDANEKTQFILPDTGSAILNRVIGKASSSIFGELLCNGQLFLINPSGVIFGKDARVETASLLASALDLSNSDFLSGGDLRFFGDSEEKIVNHGSLIAMDGIRLIAASIEQEGFCRSDRGEILLASCKEAIVDSRDGKIRIVPSTMKTLAGKGTQCGGVMEALRLTALADGNLSALAINLEGIIDADSIAIEAPNGEIFMNGSIASSDLSAQASNISLNENTKIDLSRTTGGGNGRIYAEERLFMHKGASIDASCPGDGPGGNVVLLSSGETIFEGNINARGGPLGGQGGFVEVSGPILAFKGLAATKSADGKSGTLLLDPLDIDIVNGMGTANVTTTTMGMTTTYTPNMCPGAILQDSDLNTAMGANTLVIIDTTGTVGMCAGDINFALGSLVNYTETSTLELRAAGSINFFASVINNSSGAINITQAGGNVNVIGGATTVSVETNGGPISIQNVTGNLNITGGTAMGALSRILASNATLDATVMGDINVTGGTASNTGATLRNTAAQMTLNASTISVTGGSVSSADASIFSGSNGDLVITCDRMDVNTTASGAPVSVTGDGDLNLTITQSNLTINSDNGGFANVNGSFALTATVANSIFINGMNGGFATMFGDRESVIIEATNGSFIANGSTQVYSGNLPNANLQIIAGVDIQLNGTGTFDVFAANGTITLVVDNLFPTSPGFGTGQFVLSPTASINPMGNSLQIFTADPSQNNIQGMLNGTPFVQGPPLTNTNNEQYDTYFPSAFFVSDYVVFYKTPINTPTPIPVPVIVAILQPEFADFTEGLRNLHPYSEYILGSLRFKDIFQLKKPEHQYVQHFRLRQKTILREWFAIDYDPYEF